MYPEEERPASRAFSTVLICVLAFLLLVGTAVEIAYYREMASTLNGVEHERDELRSEVNMLRTMQLQKLEGIERKLDALKSDGRTQ